MSRQTHDIRNDHFATSISPAQLTANTDNWNPTGLATTAIIRVSTDASRNLTGLVAPAAATFLWLLNVGAQDLVLVHDATSTAANRFLCPNDTDMTLPKDTAIQLTYDTTSSRWRVIGGTGGGGGGTPTLIDVLGAGNDTGGTAIIADDPSQESPSSILQNSVIEIVGANMPSGVEGGYIDLQAGLGDGSASDGGDVFIEGGQDDGTGGQVYVATGDAEVGSGKNGGELYLTRGAGDGAGRRGLVIMPNLPTSDPGVSGALYVSSGTIKISP